jgi:putative DNA primase/helicase
VVTNDIYDTARKYLKLGRCVIPSGGGDDLKKPLVEWKEYQTTKPTEEQLSACSRDFRH